MPCPENVTNKTKEKTIADARKAGIASGVVRRRRRSMQEVATLLLVKNIKRGKGCSPEDFENLAEMLDQNIDAGTAIMLSQIQKAIQGDTQSAIFVRDTVGDKAAEKIEQGITIEDYVKTHKPKF